MNRSGRALLSLALLVTMAAPAAANELRIETRGVARSSGAPTLRVEANVSWKNAWRNPRNHDAVWLIVKLRGKPGASWQHGKLRAVRAAGATPAASCTVSTDRIGSFCAASATYRGDVAWQLVLEVEPGRLAEADIAAGTVEAMVFGVEMVYVPAGPFTIGDPDPRSVEAFAFYRSDAAGNHAGTLRITSEAEIPVGRAGGSLFYKAAQYTGDALGPVPAAFPKGTRAFYVMKYEILQGQYATFLNAIPDSAAAIRSPAGARGYYEQRGSIRLTNGRYGTASPDRPANYMGWDDGTAFADWAGLRPWTELEFSKAARGPVEPVSGDFPWGTASKERLLRRNQPNDELLQTGDAAESRLTDQTRDVLGASYYWVMDLAGSVWEKVITIGHPRGRAFLGTHGDGEITRNGLATNADWPLGDDDAGGYGYRGGGHYLRGSAEGPLNPHSRVEQRPYGSWGGGPREVAYGFRAARSADR
jgi:formylglycine-generating enzyme required for sulfatase activity